MSYLLFLKVTTARNRTFKFILFLCSSVFRSQALHSRDLSSSHLAVHIPPPPRLSGIHWLHMALLCNNTFEFQSFVGRDYTVGPQQPCMHAPRDPNDMSFLAVAHFYQADIQIQEIMLGWCYCCYTSNNTQEI